MGPPWAFPRELDFGELRGTDLFPASLGRAAHLFPGIQLFLRKGEAALTKMPSLRVALLGDSERLSTLRRKPKETSSCLFVKPRSTLNMWDPHPPASSLRCGRGDQL